MADKNEICEKFGIPEEIKEECQEEYKKVVKNTSTRRTADALFSGILYMISHERDLGITLENLKEVSGFSKSCIYDNYKFVQGSLRGGPQLYGTKTLGSDLSEISDRDLKKILAIALPEIDWMCSNLDLSDDVRKKCEKFYCDYIEKRRANFGHLTTGKPIETLVISTIYAVLRKEKIPKSLKELQEASGIDRDNIYRVYNFIRKELDIHIPYRPASTYIPKISKGLGLSADIEAKAAELLDIASKKGITSGRSPLTCAAGAVYIASKLNGGNHTQLEIAKVCGIETVSVRNRYEEMVQKLEIDFGDSIGD